MSFPGDQVTAPPDRRWPHPTGAYAYRSARGSLGDEPVDFASAGNPLPVRDAAPVRTGPGRPEAGQARFASPGNVPSLSSPAVPRPRPANAPHPGAGRPPRPGSKHRAAPGWTDPGPAGAVDVPGRHRRDPARGYPPRPGDPGPRYPQAEFSAWNEPGTSAPRAQQARERLPYSAPTWADTGNAAAASPGHGSGLALAERGDDDLARSRDGGLAGSRDGGLAGISDDGVAGWTVGPADTQALASGEPSHPAAGIGTIDRVPEPADSDAVPLAGAEAQSSAGSLPAIGSLRDAGPHPHAGSRPDAGPRPDGAAGRTASPAGVTRAAAARARKDARRRGRTRRRVVMAGVCLPAIAVLAAVAYTRYPGGHTPASSPKAAASSANAPASSPTSPGSPAALSASQPSRSLGPWKHIATRATDPSPLTLSQLFPARFSVGSTAYTRTAQLASAHCSGAVFGANLQAAARKYQCSQVLRASYLAKGPKLMGTIGVLNLSTSAGAKDVGKVTGSSQFIAQLAARSGPTRSLAKGTGLEEAEVKGHYLILTWVEFTTLRAPHTAHQKAQLKAFSANLISRTANVSLTSRMVTGEPQVP
jgi:hypothetical protein